MRILTAALKISIVSLLICQAGCESPSTPQPLLPADSNGNDIPACAYYCPARISIMPLTDFTGMPDGQKPSKIDIYISLLDSFGIQVKYPAVFRFELYEYVQLTGDHKGKRVIWPDFDLNDPQANQRYWQDFLRAYFFSLPFEPADRPYLLEVTCTCGYGKRLSARFELR